MMKLLVRVLLFISCVSVTDCLFCYQCADSSDKTGRNQCQTYVRTMNRYRERYTDDTYSVNKYVKNCTGYRGLDDLDIYCMIAEVIAGDAVRSYIRGCTDGYDFLDVDADIKIEEKINFENRTQCVNIRGGLRACITICGSEHGDFCNGFVSEAGRTIPSVVCTLLWTVYVFLSVVVC